MAQKLSDKAKENKKKYDEEYKKRNYKKITIQLKKKEAEELEAILLKKGINKPQFIRLAIEKLK